MFIKRVVKVVTFSGLSVFAPSIYAQTGIPTTVQEVKTAYYEIMDKDTVTLSFDKDQSGVSEAQASSLKALVDSSSKDASVKKFIVAAWSDKDFPATRSVKLSKGDEKLAEQRKDKVAKALKDLGVKNVDSYSMAKHPMWISKVFHTDESRIKGENKDRNKDSDDLAIEHVGKRLRDLGGAGKTVIIVKR